MNHSKTTDSPKDTVASSSSHVERFLNEERVKLKRADELYNQINRMHKWSPFNLFYPRYHRLVREYKEVIGSFRNPNEL